MFDVLPPQHGGGDSGSGNSSRDGPRRARKITPRVSSQQPAGGGGDSERVVQVNWKLPARLRKPIRQQLAKERKKKRERDAIIQFDRKPIKTRPLLVADTSKQRGKRVRKPTRRIFNRGVEHHTGDTYRQTKPALHVAAPPYVGNAAVQGYSHLDAKRRRAAMEERRSVLPRSPQSSRAQPPRIVRKHHGKEVTDIAGVSNARALASRGTRRSSGTSEMSAPGGYAPVSGMAAERDIPYQWDSYEGYDEASDSGDDVFMNTGFAGDALRRPRRFVFSFRGIPSLLFKKKERERTGSYKTVNAAILAFGCVIAAVVVWNLQGVGRGFSVLSSVEERSRNAFDNVLTAQSALAETDFDTSEQVFRNAEKQLAEARAELSEALSASRLVLRYVDVTGTVASGEELLEAGEQLTQAGQHVSRGVAPLMNANVAFADGGNDISSDASLVDAVRGARAEFGQAITNLERAERSIEDIGSPFLPKDLREHVATLQATIPRARELLQTVHDESDTLLYLLGEQHDRQYLVLFANNDEIRPVGGFIGTVGLLNIDRGRVENIDVQSVYNTDGQLQDYIAPPDPLLPIVNRWYLRDTNWFADYRVSAQKAASFFEKEGGPTVDGVILMTPPVIERLLAVTGPIDVPGYNVTVSKENFVEVTQGEVTYEYDKELNKPKQFLADITPLLMNRLFEERDDGEDGTKQKIETLNALTASLNRKDMLLYFRDDTAQRRVEELRWGGSFPDDSQGFLSVNNANIGGHKSDQFIDQEIDYRSEVQLNGDAEVTVTVRRTHNGPSEKLDFEYPDKEDPAFKNNVVYQRVFVPNDAELIESNGFSSIKDVPKVVSEEAPVDLRADEDVANWLRGQHQTADGTTIGHEAGKMFFANWIVTKPGETSVVLYRYRVPDGAPKPNLFDPAKKYSVYFAKQPGAQRTTVRAELSLPSAYSIDHIVPERGVTIGADQSIVYRGEFQEDALVGVVYQMGE